MTSPPALSPRVTRHALLVTTSLLLCLAAAAAGAQGLRPVGRLPSPPIRESSGLVASGRVPGLFWTHGDSGNEARLYPVGRDGRLRSPAGVRVQGALNRDWEDLARDDRGNLWVGDIGNNDGRRDEFQVYVVPEPDPGAPEARARTLRFAYPDGARFDAEALFWWRGSAWVVAKYWLGGPAEVYRLDVRDPDGLNPVAAAGEHHFASPVTAADASPDGRRVVVLTYAGLWLFEPPDGADHPFTGPVRRLRLSAGQCEAVCLAGDAVLVGNEAGELWEVPLGELEAP